MTNYLERSLRIGRRRFITIAAAIAGYSALPHALLANQAHTISWRGIALGAPAILTLQHPDATEAKDAIAACLGEVARLEAIFSLYRPDSALVQLNDRGHLDESPVDLRLLLSEALALSSRTNGAFDPTVQPLWELYARHFAQPGADPAGPEIAEIESVRDLVDWRQIQIDGSTVRFAKKGMSITLNGIAQGYITDKVGEILRAFGFTHVLIDMGEQLALGPKWDGTAWHVGIRNPSDPERWTERLAISGGAVATSGSGNTTITAGSLFAHLFDPRTGRPTQLWASVSVVSDRATHADGLSTALTVMPEPTWRNSLGSTARAYAIPSGKGKGYWV